MHFTFLALACSGLEPHCLRSGLQDFNHFKQEETQLISMWCIHSDRLKHQGATPRQSLVNILSVAGNGDYWSHPYIVMGDFNSVYSLPQPNPDLPPNPDHKIFVSSHCLSLLFYFFCPFLIGKIKFKLFFRGYKQWRAQEMHGPSRDAPKTLTSPKSRSVASLGYLRPGDTLSSK